MAITKGIYICANEPTEPSADMFLELGSFTSNNKSSCFEIQYNSTTRKLFYNTFGDDSYEVYNYATKTWTNNAWKTIDITSTNSAGNDWFFANYTKQTTKLSIDLTTLPGWANLSTGNHTIKIKAKGTGYIDSELSAGVVVSKAAETVTLEAGTYKFVNSPAKQNIQQDIAFTSFNTNYIAIAMYESTNRIMYSSEEGPGIVYNGRWSKTAWQTITLSTDQQVSAEFYKWAITDGNLVKQAAVTN